MPNKIILTESQFNMLVEQQLLNEMFSNLKAKVIAGIISGSMAIAAIESSNMPENVKQQYIQQIEAVSDNTENQGENSNAEYNANSNDSKEEVSDWQPIANDCVVTVYNAVPQQCNADVSHTASMFRLNLQNPETHKIVAVERTFMKEFGLKYGDVIKIEGTHKGLFDGIYQIQDTMNKKFAGQHKVDILVPNDVHFGGTMKDSPATVYVLKDKSKTEEYKSDMAPQMPKTNKNV